MTWHRPHAEARPAGDTVLCTRQQAAYLAHVHPDKVRRYCPPRACDIATRAVLVALEDVERLANVRT